MDTTPAVAQRPPAQVWPVIAGAVLVAAGIWLAVAERQAIPAAIAGAGGLALLRWAIAERPYSQALVAVDAAVFALFALARNDGLGFWQLPGPWLDVLRFNLPSAAIGLIVYAGASAMALVAGSRGLRIVEALSLIVVPYLFNILIVVGADWHMAEIGAFVTQRWPAPFPIQVAIGRALTLWLLGEAMLAVIVAVSLNRPPRSLRVVALFGFGSAYAAFTPLVANAAQLVTQPLLAIVFSALCAALAQAGLWAIVYLMTGVTLDWLAGRPPRWEAAWDHWRSGAVKGAIYGALFIGFILIAAFVLGIPGATGFLRAFALVAGPVLGAALFPLAMTVVGSADGTPPFFGRLRAAYRDPRAPVRGVVAGLGLALAYVVNLSAYDGGTRFLAAAAIGALCFAGVDLGFDAFRIASGERAKMQVWRIYALGAVLGALVAGALGWYFDTAQVQVVIAKFWAYADVNYRVSGRRLGDFTTYPIFNKYGQVNLGEVAGGVRLFWSESVAGVINWSLAAPLFSINYVLLDALLQRSLRPIRNLLSPKGVEILVEQGVRVLRWGLWMAPIINSFLRQSPDPSWYNQDGAVRTAVVIGADGTQTPEAFRRFSLTLFLGLLAYDWLRVLIWFDHMGLRVASLVNLSFLGGDRADEAAARFVGHNGRTRAIPDGIRRFMTWAPLLIPFYIPRGTEWDFAWTGAEKLARDGGPMPEPIRTLAWAYGGAGAVFAAVAVAIVLRQRGKTGEPAPWLAGAPAELARNPRSYAFTNGAVGVELFRDGRGAAYVMGAERGGGGIDLIRRPLDPLQARGHFFYVTEDGDAPWSIGFEPARRAGEYRIEEPGFHRLAIVHVVNGIEARMEIGPDAGQAAVLSWKIRLTDRSGQAAPATTDQLLRDRRPRDGRLRARPRFRRHACRDDLRSRAERHPRPQSAPAVGARRPRRGGVLRGEAGGRRRTRRLRGFAHPLPRRRLDGCAHRLRALAMAQARRRGQALDLRSRRELQPRVDAARERRGRGRIRHGPRRQRRLGRGADRAPARAAGAARARPRTPDLRDPRGRAVACAAEPLAVQPVGRRPPAHADPSDAASLGARDGERTRHVDHGLERRRGVLRLRQRPPERPDCVSLRQRDRRDAGADRLHPRSRRQRDGRPELLSVPARGRRLERGLRAGRRDLHKKPRRPRDGLRRVRPARPSVRRPHSDAAEQRRPPKAFARGPVLRPGARGEPQRKRREDPRRDGRKDARLPEPEQRLRARLRLRRDQPCRSGDRDDPHALLRRPGTRHPYACFC